MAQITPFIGPNTYAGESEEIDAAIIFHIKVGTGKVTECSDYALAFNGYIDSTFWSGNFDLRVELTDHNSSSSSGSCTVSFNGQNSDATYQVEGDSLVIIASLANDKQEKISIRRSGNYTEIDLSGAVSPPEIILEPES